MSYDEGRRWVAKGLADWVATSAIVVRKTGARISWPPRRFCGMGDR